MECSLSWMPFPGTIRFSCPQQMKKKLHNTTQTLLIQGHAIWTQKRWTTYQRLMTKIFKPLIGHTVEVYIDNIVVKSKTRDEHD